MSAPEPRANPLLRGHAGPEATLARAARTGRMHHAWLLAGPQGIGKATLAYRFARRLLAGLPEGDDLALDPSHPVFRRVAAGTHADLLSIARAYDEKRKRLQGEIVVDAVRQISGFLRLTPAEGGWRVVVVDGAEEMNRHAANALLKVLEEPPPRALLLLACSAPGRLLPTIRSRCRRLRLSPLGEADMADLLPTYLPEMEADARDRLVALAEGSPGRALTLAEADGPALAALVEQVLDDLPALTPARRHAVADALARSDDGFATFMDLLRASIASAVRAAARGETDPDQARIAGLRSLDGWAELWQGLSRLQDETERFNLDKRQAVLIGLARLVGSSHRVDKVGV